MRPHAALLSSLMTSIIMIGMLCGCFFRDLKNDLAEYDASYALVGKVVNPNEGQGKVIVILYSEESDGGRLPVSCMFPEDTGHFSFLVKPGVYYLKAFEDSNENFDYDPGEYAGAFSDPIRITPVNANAAGKVKRARQNLDIQLSPAQAFIDDLDKLSDLAIEQMPLFKVGVVKKLNDGLFDEANGSIGYWKPLTFIKQFGIGIYFTEPFDPKRIPILFVHGATGTPAGWQDMVDQLDRKRYQPWFYYYPSGIRLDVAGEILNGLIQALHDKYGFDRLYITAHSMGGLVSRAAILKNHNHTESSYIKLFVSISTPWGGVRMAEKGAEKAPTAIPCWHDLAPGSEFIRWIYNQSLSPYIPFYLFFSHKGNCSLFMENNDETIELKSLLDYRAQDDAAGIYGFNEGHAGILTSHETIVRYLKVLKSVR